jgi:hypothetical protein
MNSKRNVYLFAFASIVITTGVLFLASYEETPKRAQPWQSVQACYDDHIAHARGGFPRPGDDPQELMDFCESVYNDARYCNFECLPRQSDWALATQGPTDTHTILLQRYYKIGP